MAVKDIEKTKLICSRRVLERKRETLDIHRHKEVDGVCVVFMGFRTSSAFVRVHMSSITLDICPLFVGNVSPCFGSPMYLLFHFTMILMAIQDTLSYGFQVCVGLQGFIASSWICQLALAL